ncbi:DnaB-like helicase C-terminal domain-containing protein [Clostridioides difficile]|nr:DnaB-like helicase C-terminal domain-containing protein [Clostridioides difficile]
MNNINDEINEGAKTRIKFLENIIGGLYGGELTPIAVKSRRGEVSNIQILFKNIASLTGISIVKMKNKNLDDDEIVKYIQVLSIINQENNLYINDSVNTISGIKREIKSIKSSLVIIDYLQILDYEAKEIGETKFADLSEQVKNITLKFNISVVQFAQLNTYA